MTKTQREKTFLGIFTIQTDGRIKLSKAQQLVNLNQYKSTWIPTNARNLARGINNSSIIIK